MIIAVLGFAGSGKTTYLRKHLYPQLREQGASFFVQSANPDGEGQWTVEAEARDRRNKGEFSERFVDWVIDGVKTLARQFDLVYLDCGGQMSEENRRILELCDEVIVIGRTRDEYKMWQRFALDCKRLPVKFVLSSTDEQGESVFRMEDEEILQ